MKFLLDECCDARLAALLAASGFDCVQVGRDHPRALDREVWDMAIVSNRVLITNDTDFGLLHQRRTRRPNCVVLLRLDAMRPLARLDRTLAAIQALGETGLSGFVVIEPGLIRRSRD